MKSRLGILSLGLFSMMAAASAATINCTPQNLNTITNSVLTSPVVFTCAATNAAPGSVITAVSLDVFFSFQDSIPGGAHQLSATATENSAEIAGLSTTVLTTPVDPTIAFAATTGFFNGTFAPGGGTVADLASLASFQVSVAVTDLGSPIPANASISVAYTTTEVSGVPEPTSMILLGSGFLAIGFAARKRKVRA